MKRVLSSLAVCVATLLVVDATFAATGRGRLGVGTNVMSVSRMPSIPVAPIGVTTSVSDVKNTPGPMKPEPSETKPDTKPDEKPDDKPDEKPDTREKEREACIRNNIGIGNTFVWASRFSDINNYATMVEDVEHPENNTCFVRVDLKSTDSRIDLSDIGGKYFEMGRNITCGSWVDESIIEKRILDAKKTARTWATVGGAVGGTALGVGAMELFGNNLLSKAGVKSVQGQEGLVGNELLKSQLAVMKKEEPERYANFVEYLNKYKKACEGSSNDKCKSELMGLEISE